jgi:hypothetical protein
MSMVVRNVLTQQLHESLGGIPRLYPSLQLMVLSPEHNPVLVDLDESMLGYRRSLDVSADIAKKMGLRLTVRDVNAPPSLGLLRQHRLQFLLPHL